MPRIKFSYLTHEIEISGPESFVAEIFDWIGEPLNESIGVERKKMLTAEASFEKTNDIQGSTSTAASSAPAAKRPPLRKYIRREGSPGQERIVVEVAQEKPAEMTLASLKEKFGLTGSKFGAIRDAETLGTARRRLHESSPWKQG